MDLECHPRRDFHNLVGRDLLEFVGQINSCFNQFELPRGCNGRNRFSWLRDLQGKIQLENLGESPLILDQILWRVSGLEIVSLGKTKFIISRACATFCWAEFVQLLLDELCKVEKGISLLPSDSNMQKFLQPFEGGNRAKFATVS